MNVNSSINITSATLMRQVEIEIAESGNSEEKSFALSVSTRSWSNAFKCTHSSLTGLHCKLFQAFSFFVMCWYRDYPSTKTLTFYSMLYSVYISHYLLNKHAFPSITSTLMNTCKANTILYTSLHRLFYRSPL